YDLDNTLGIDWVGVNWTSRNIYGYAPSSEQRPLFKRLMLNPTYRARFSQHINELCNGWLSASNIQSQITQWQTMIAPYVQTDAYYPLDYGYDFADFLQAHTTAQGGHVAYGILPFLEARRTAALSQLESYTANSNTPFYLILEGLQGSYRLRARISGINGASVIPSYSLDNTTFTDLTWNTDPVVADEYYSIWFEPASNSDKLYFRLRFTDGTVYPCVTPFTWITEQDAGLLINECMSSNTSVVADDWGEFDDWMELFSSSTPFWNDLFITDDSVNTNRFALPNLNFASNPFPLVWLDDDREQGDFHAGFKLSNGERLFLYQLQEGVPRLLDKTDVLVLPAESSWQRIPNGSDVISMVVPPTPGGSNGGVSDIEQPTNVAVQLYPNPTSDWIYCSHPLHDVRIYDPVGKCIASYKELNRLDVQAWSNGCYFIQSKEGVFRFTVSNH
ncbi:MAG: CotH kinase family protein, partial [Flavobacteriales bacterium]